MKKLTMICLIVFFIPAAVFSAGFVNNGNGTVSDTLTGRMWQQAPAPNAMIWKDALYYCENLTLAGYSDWRLPDINELQSLVDYTKIYPNPSIDTNFSINECWWYWSSTTNRYYNEYAWYVYFNYGNVCNDYKTYNYCVRCVRGGQSGSFDNLII